MGRTIDIFYTHRERAGGKAHMNIWERSKCNGKGPHVFMGRTIDILYTHRERPGGNGKEPLTLCTPIGTDQGVIGRTIGTLYTYRERPGGTGKARMYVWEGPLISFIPIGKDQEGMGKNH